MDSVSKNKRLRELSLLNVFFCFLVILIHVSSEPVTQLQKVSWQYLAVMVPWRLSACAVPGFIFLSGLKLFLNKGNRINYKKFYRSRFLKIVLPYILWVTIYYYYFVSHGYFSFSFTELFRYMAIGDLVGHLYFVVIIVQFYLFAPLWMVLIKKLDPRIFIPASLLITILCKRFLPDLIPALSPVGKFPFNDRLLTSWLIYWISGCYAGLYYESFKKMLVNKRALFINVFIFFALAETLTSYFAFARGVKVSGLEYVHIGFCLVAIPFIFLVFSIITKKSECGFRLISEIDMSSYIIYLAHPLTIFIINDKMTQAGIVSIGSRFFLRALFAYVATISLCIMWNKLKNLVLNRRRIT